MLLDSLEKMHTLTRKIILELLEYVVGELDLIKQQPGAIALGVEGFEEIKEYLMPYTEILGSGIEAGIYRYLGLIRNGKVSNHRLGLLAFEELVTILDNALDDIRALKGVNTRMFNKRLLDSFIALTTMKRNVDTGKDIDDSDAARMAVEAKSRMPMSIEFGQPIQASGLESSVKQLELQRARLDLLETSHHTLAWTQKYLVSQKNPDPHKKKKENAYRTPIIYI